MGKNTTKVVTCIKCREGRFHYGKGFCHPCYQLHGRTNITCVECGKEAKHIAKSLCRSCYKKQRPKVNCSECGRLNTKNGTMCGSCTSRMHTYGLKPGEFKALMLQQGSRCAICRNPFENYRDVHLDHHHETGKVRGILHTLCNISLSAPDRYGIDWLNKAATYLSESKKTEVACA